VTSDLSGRNTQNDDGRSSFSLLNWP
jgi:hypothetical protein